MTMRKPTDLLAFGRHSPRKRVSGGEVGVWMRKGGKPRVATGSLPIESSSPQRGSVGGLSDLVLHFLT